MALIVEVSPQQAFNRMFQDFVLLDFVSQGPKVPHSAVSVVDMTQPPSKAVERAIDWAQENSWPDPASHAIVFDSGEDVEVLQIAAEHLAAARVKEIWRVDRSSFLEQYRSILEKVNEEDLIHLPQEVVPGLFLGSELALQEETLDALNITRVLSVVQSSKKLECPGADTVHRLHHRCAIEDELNSDLGTVLDEGLQFIADALAAEKRVLVHCEQGKSRSGSVVVAHVMRSQRGLSYDAALRLVKTQRIMVKPNSAFEQQLRAWSSE